MDEHPEASTTIQDNSLTFQKFSNSLKEIIYKTFNTKNDMVNDTSLVAGQTVMTLGYFTINDGGGAAYYIKSSNETTNEVTTILLENGLIAEMVIGEYVNLLSCGIKSDNSADQYGAFFEAFHALNGKTKAIYLPSGYYIISDILLIPPDTTLYGDGASTILYYSAAYANFGAGVTNGGDNVTIKNISIEHLPSDNMWQTKGSVLGGIGFSTCDFNSWTAEHQATISRRNTKNLSAINLYSDSLYPLQTETDTTYTIENVTYSNIHAPNGMVSVLPKSTINDIKIENVTCFLLRIGQGAGNSNSIHISNIFAKTMALTMDNIKANNLTINSTGVTDFTRYETPLFIGSSSQDGCTEINGLTVISNDAQSYFTYGILSTAYSLKLCNVKVSGYSKPYQAGYANRYTYAINCDFIGGEVAIKDGMVVNCTGNFAANSTPSDRLVNGTITSGASITLPIRSGIIYMYRSSVTATPRIVLIDRWHGITDLTTNTTIATVTMDAETATITNNDKSIIEYLALRR